MRFASLTRLDWVADAMSQAIWALRDNRLRTTLSIAGIAVGIAAVVAVGSVSEGGRYVIFRELETFGLNSVWVWRDDQVADPQRGRRLGAAIDTADYEAIRAGCCPAVRRVTPLYSAWDSPRPIRVGSRYVNPVIEGVGVDYLAMNNEVVERGRPFREADERERRAVVLLGATVRRDLFGEQADPVGREMQVGDRKVVVIGVLKAKSRDFLASIGVGAAFGDPNNRLLMPFTTLQQMRGETQLHALQAEAVGSREADAAAAQIVALLGRRHRGQFAYGSDTAAKYIATANRILQGVSAIGVLAASISLLVGGLGIMNIMSTSVLERTREIGLRKAVGARNRDILGQFLLEATMISTLGGAIGLTLGWGMSAILAWWTAFPLLPPWWMTALAVFMSVGVGLLSGYYPARRAARMRPVEALRYE